MAPAATIDEVRALAEKLYRDLRSKVFGPNAPPPADLEVLGIDDPNAGYSPSANKIRIPVPSGNLEDWDVLDVAEWPVWKVDLVEEMIHEYQHKVGPAPTRLGKALSEKYGPCCAGPGHDEVFFTSLEVFAPHLGCDSEDLAHIIVSVMA